MNLQSEIQYFGELTAPNQARLLTLFLHELSVEARGTYGPQPDQVVDGARLRFIVEIVTRLTRFIEQLLSDDHNRPQDEVLLRMLLAPRGDKTAERLVLNAYRRAIQGFDSNDTTVTMTTR